MIPSPFDLNISTSTITTIESKRTIEQYLKEYNIDVSEYFTTGTYTLLQCNKTKYRFFYPSALEGNERLYINLAKNRHNYYRFPKWEHLVVAEFLFRKPLKNLLEIGCANGEFMQYLNSKQSIDITGIELNSQAAEQGRKNGLKILTEKIEDHIKRGSLYDAVCSFQVLEHIFDVKSFIVNSIELLNSKGLFIFGVPNSNPFLYYYDSYHTLNLPPHHMGLWNKKAVINVAKHFNLKVVKVYVERPNDDEIMRILNFWRVSNHFVHRLLGKVFRRLLQIPNVLNSKKVILAILRHSLEGRNLVAILQKTI